MADQSRPYVKIGAAFKRFRVARPNLSHRQLAGRAGVSHGLISQVETGQVRPSPEYIFKVAPHLNTRPENLLLIAGYIDADQRWIDGVPPEQATPTLPADPLAAVAQALQQGAWPENVTAAVYCLLAATVDDKRTLWQRRFDAAVALLEQETDGLEDDEPVLRVRRTPPTEESREALLEYLRTFRQRDWMRLRNLLFAGGATNSPMS